MKLTNFRQVARGSLIGFASVELDSGLTIHDVALHSRDGARWAQLPGRPMLDRDGQVMRGEDGKLKYAPVVEIPERARRDNFGRQVWDAFERHGIQGGTVS